MSTLLSRGLNRLVVVVMIVRMTVVMIVGVVVIMIVRMTVAVIVGVVVVMIVHMTVVVVVTVGVAVRVPPVDCLVGWVEMSKGRLRRTRSAALGFWSERGLPARFEVRHRSAVKLRTSAGGTHQPVSISSTLNFSPGRRWKDSGDND